MECYKLGNQLCDSKDVKFEGAYLKIDFYDRLYWDHSGIMRIIQGIPVQNILGNEKILIRAKHLPFYTPRPGAVDVVLGTVLCNPKNLHPRKIFMKVAGKF